MTRWDTWVKVYDTNRASQTEQSSDTATDSNQVKALREIKEIMKESLELLRKEQSESKYSKCIGGSSSHRDEWFFAAYLVDKVMLIVFLVYLAVIFSVLGSSFFQSSSKEFEKYNISFRN